MRKELSKRYYQRDKFYGEFERFGIKTNSYTGKQERTLLFINVRDKSGKLITDHLWFNDTKGFQKANLKEGDLLRFEARIDIYMKGYEKDMIDYKLSRPTNIVKIRSFKFKVQRNDNPIESNCSL